MFSFVITIILKELDSSQKQYQYFYWYIKSKIQIICKEKSPVDINKIANHVDDSLKLIFYEM